MIHQTSKIDPFCTLIANFCCLDIGFKLSFKKQLKWEHGLLSLKGLPSLSKLNRPQKLTEKQILTAHTFLIIVYMPLYVFVYR